MSRITTAKRLRFTPLALTTVLLSAGLLSLSVTGTLSGFTAAITNSTNSAASGTLTMQETSPSTTTVCSSTDGAGVSTNTATCSAINKFGGSTAMTPGQTVSTSVTIKNTGTVTATTFSLTPGTTCTQSANGTVNGSATDLCAKMMLSVTQGSSSIFSGSLTEFKGKGQIALGSLAAGNSSTYIFAVTLPSTVDNTYQGLAASMPMTWTFNS